MKKLFVILVAILSIGISQKASAYAFYAVNSDNDTIYYGFIYGSDSTVKVTYEGTVGSSHGMATYSGKKYVGDITIPPTVTYNEKTYTVSVISWYAFWHSPNLLSITLPETITIIESDAFNSCTNLRAINFTPSATTKMIIDYRAFIECESLVYLNFPNSVIAIGEEAFRSCSKLETVLLGDSVSFIGRMAFNSSPSLSFICYSKTPPTAEQYPFGFESLVKSILVPCKCVEAYESAPNWDIYDYSSCIGLDEISTNSLDIIVYPNPAKDNITIRTNGLINSNLFIYDILGRELIRKQINYDETIIDISTLDLGAYILKAISKDNKIIGNSKFVKQ